MENGFSERMAKLSDSELENILAHRDDWQPEAVEAAKKEATKRNLLFSTDEQFREAKQAKRQQAKQQFAPKRLNVLIKNRRPQQDNHNSNNYSTIKNIKRFFMFDFLITPWIIRIIYWLLQIIIVIGSFGIMIGYNNIFSYYLYGFMGGLIFLIVGSLVLRLITELLIIVFKIAENTEYLKKEDNDI